MTHNFQELSKAIKQPAGQQWFWICSAAQSLSKACWPYWCVKHHLYRQKQVLSGRMKQSPKEPTHSQALLLTVNRGRSRNRGTHQVRQHKHATPPHIVLRRCHLDLVVRRRWGRRHYRLSILGALEEGVGRAGSAGSRLRIRAIPQYSSDSPAEAQDSRSSFGCAHEEEIQQAFSADGGLCTQKDSYQFQRFSSKSSGQQMLIGCKREEEIHRGCYAGIRLCIESMLSSE